MSMRVGLYSPYLRDHTGGGERYMLAVAKCLEDEFVVDVVIDSPTETLSTIRNRLEKTLHIPLKKAQFVSGPFGKRGSFIDRILFTKRYDVFYYLTDGSFFSSQARYNVTHIQVPIPNPIHGAIAKLKFAPWKTRIANSEFTQKNVERLWDINVQYVHRVPVQIDSFSPGEKENVILSVGRFFTGLHEKKHHILIQAFRTLYKQGYPNWSLVLAGAVDPGEENQHYVKQLRALSKGLPVTFVPDAPFSTLVSLYAKASLYWHAAGFGENELVHPERFEHFGITTVEAMASGCVPIVVNGGGQREIIKDGVNGENFNSIEELVEKTKALIHNSKRRNMMARKARFDSEQFSEQAGCVAFKQILGEITR